MLILSIWRFFNNGNKIFVSFLCLILFLANLFLANFYLSNNIDSLTFLQKWVDRLVTDFFYRFINVLNTRFISPVIQSSFFVTGSFK